MVLSREPRVMPGAGNSNTWVDGATDAVEEAAFIGPVGQRLMAFAHYPATLTPSTLLVLCGSLYEDLQVNYRPQLLLARALVRRGCAVARFHYRGTGNSDDLRSGAVTHASMQEDARLAHAWLADRWPSAHPVFCGARMGALVASELAVLQDGSLVLWAPALSGAEYFRKLSRASRLAGVRATARKRQPSGGLVSALEAGTPTEMLGHQVHPTSYRDLRSRVLPATMGPGRRVLLIELGLGESGSSDVAALGRRWQLHGAAVQHLRVRAREQWFVPNNWEPEDDNPDTAALVDGISRWVVP